MCCIARPILDAASAHVSARRLPHPASTAGRSTSCTRDPSTCATRASASNDLCGQSRGLDFRGLLAPSPAGHSRRRKLVGVIDPSSRARRQRTEVGGPHISRRVRSTWRGHLLDHGLQGRSELISSTAIAAVGRTSSMRISSEIGSHTSSAHLFADPWRASGPRRARPGAAAHVLPGAPRCHSLSPNHLNEILRARDRLTLL